MTPSFPKPGGKRAHTLFLNFDGADISPGNGDARTDHSELVRRRSRVPVFDATNFGGDATAARDEITLTVAELFAAYDLRVETVRPHDTEDYVMVMIGGSPSDIDVPSGARGYAPLDCDDNNTHDIVFVFSDALGLDFVGDPHAASLSVAAVAAQESAHAYGLVHTDNDQDVMFPYVVYPTGRQHFAAGRVMGLNCDRTDFQDSAQFLMQTLGARR